MTGREWCAPIRSKVPPRAGDDPHRGIVGPLALAATFSDFLSGEAGLAQLLRIALLDYLIRPRQQRRRDRQAEGLGGLEVDHQLELRGLLDGQIGGLGALEDLVDIDCGMFRRCSLEHVGP